MGIQESFIAFLTFSLAPADAINIVSAAAVSAGQPHYLAASAFRGGRGGGVGNFLESSRCLLALKDPSWCCPSGAKR